MTDVFQTRVLFFGTSEFAIPSLEALAEDGYQIAGVVTKPDEPAGRKLELTSPPVKKWAEKHRVPVFQPASVERGAWSVEELPEAGVFIVAAYGKIIPKEIFETPKYGTLNIHPSLLPRWRGPSPIQYAILNGDTETGVTIIQIDELMDHGDVVASSILHSPFSILTYPQLHDRLAKLGAELLVETLPQWIAGDITPRPQDESKATWSKKITKDDGRINWQKPAEEIERMARAFTPWPGAWTMWHDGDAPKRIRIDEAVLFGDDTSERRPGSVFQSQNTSDHLLVQSGKGVLAIKKLTLEGKKTLAAAEFLRGYPSFARSLLI